MAYSQKVVDKFEQTLKNPKEASVGRWKPGDKDFHRVGTNIRTVSITENNYIPAIPEIDEGITLATNVEQCLFDAFRFLQNLKRFIIHISHVPEH